MTMTHKKAPKKPWQLLKDIIHSGRMDEWIIDIDPYFVKFSIKSHNRKHWIIFEDNDVLIEIPDQGFSVNLVRLVNQHSAPYHVQHDVLGSEDTFEPDELHLLRAIYDIYQH